LFTYSSAYYSYSIDPDFQIDELKIQFSENEELIKIISNDCRVEISKPTLSIQVFNKHNHPIVRDSEEGFGCITTIHKGVVKVSVRQSMEWETSFWGLGDKTGHLNLRGATYSNWCNDAFGYGNSSNELYRAIPFFLKTEDENSCGIFVDNTHRTLFDFGHTHYDEYEFGAEGGNLNYYVFCKSNPLDILSDYAKLTGKPQMPPMWALGYHQCRWSYFPESRVMEVAHLLKQHEIPCDALYLDIDYMDAFRCFTWNKSYFPNPAKMIQGLNDIGFNLVVMIDPGIKVDPDYPVFQEGYHQDYFCKRINGSLMIGPVWPQDCAFPDFTNPEVRTWWADLYKVLIDNGVSGFWNDMNEPAVFQVNNFTFPNDVIHYREGHPTNHREAHNIYGMQMARASYEGIKKHNPTKRTFLLTRANFSGGQRYAAVWTGDNLASWEHLKIANRQVQRLCMSGFSFTGTDIGGFAGTPDSELFVRWLQLSVFHPLMRVHYMGNNEHGSAEVDVEQIESAIKSNRIDREPWSFGEKWLPLIKSAIELRYTLLPYFYSLIRVHSNTGKPFLHHLWLEDPSDFLLKKVERDFMCGNHLLVSPIEEPDCSHQIVCFPQGEWFQWKNSTSFAGQREYEFPVELDKLLLFVKAGSIIPKYPIRLNTKIPVPVLMLDVYYQKGSLESFLYEDEGEGYDYQKGKFNVYNWRTTGDSIHFEILQTTFGSYQTKYSTMKIEIFGLPFTPKHLMVDNKPRSFDWEKNSMCFQIEKDWYKIVVA